MEAYLVVGACVAIIFVTLVWRILQKSAVKRRLRAELAHSEPGGPHRHHHDGASGADYARLATLNATGAGARPAAPPGTSQVSLDPVG